MRTKDSKNEQPCTLQSVTNCKITAIEKQFLLEDYKVGDEIEMLNGKYKVVANDMNQITFEPIECNLWYKYSFDIEARTETYRQIIDGEIVESTK